MLDSFQLFPYPPSPTPFQLHGLLILIHEAGVGEGDSGETIILYVAWRDLPASWVKSIEWV